jgi:TolB protein
MRLSTTTMAVAVLALGACSDSSATTTPTTTPTTTTPATTPTTTAPPPTTASPTTTRPTTAAPAVEPGDVWIAYQRTDLDTGAYGVHLIRPDGSGMHWTMRDVPGAGQEHPDWSPDGARLVFKVDDTDDTADVWVADVDGANAIRVVDCVAPCAWADEPAWSPDGQRIAFDRAVRDGPELHSTVELLDLATGTSTVVATAPSGSVYLAPRWAPDGRRLAVEIAVSDTGDENGEVIEDAIGVLDLDDLAAGVRTVTQAVRLANNPDWSPVDDMLVFSAPVAGTTGTDLYALHLVDQRVVRLTTFADNGGQAREPTFTPDGTAVAFAFIGGPTAPYEQMAIVDADGTVRPLGGSTFQVGAHPRVRPTRASA